jgi:hypothetical protein
MATEDNKHQPVREGDDVDEPSGGEWEYFVHDCRTPSLAEIQTRNAAVGTVWKCGDCGNRWKLINHTKHRSTVLSAPDQLLVWRRISPIKEDGEEQK